MSAQGVEHTWSPQAFAELAANLRAGDRLYVANGISLSYAPRRFRDLLERIAARGLDLTPDGSPYYFAVRERAPHPTRTATAAPCAACRGEVWHSRCRRCGTRAVEVRA